MRRWPGASTDWPARALLLAHFGLFLMWQPVWRGERDIEPRYAILVIVIGVLLAALEQLVADGGVARGAVRPDRRQRAGQRQSPPAPGRRSLAAVYLLSMLLMWVVPHLFADQSLEAVHGHAGALRPAAVAAG